MHLDTYLGLALRSERTLAGSLRTVAQGHVEHPDVVFTCQALAAISDGHVKALQPIVDRYGQERHGDDVEEPERLHAAGLAEVRTGAVGLLRDLQDLQVLVALVQSTWTVVGQAAQGLRDEELGAVAQDALAGVARQQAWLTTRITSAAPQALIVSR